MRRALPDEDIELRAVLAGEVSGPLCGLSAAAYIRSRRLVPLLIQCVADRASLVTCCGSRAAQPARARAFIDWRRRRGKVTASLRCHAERTVEAQLDPGLRGVAYSTTAGERLLFSGLRRRKTIKQN
jgi:hypothetical protein